MPGEATRFDGSRATLEREASTTYDFDGDGQFDTTVLGRLTEDAEGNDLFQRAAEDETPDVQGVWLSSRGSGPTFDAEGQTEELPDLTRLPDWSADFDDRALLSEL
ncbi:hypothetical protein, partial [Thiohalomonas denitrificans]|uniref:hypothetical protein n=1 Tax=Thiohalomonas denitrificans TaxID=415747 RepID=UPI0026F1D3A1